jgi:hypothetical protein
MLEHGGWVRNRHHCPVSCDKLIPGLSEDELRHNDSKENGIFSSGLF